MDCATCGRANRAGARFCGGCGRPLAPRCPKCGIETQPGAQFCDACGAPLAAAQPPASEARKVVTIVFADLIGSTALHERLDAESARGLMDRYHRAMSAAVETHGGTVMQLLGDGVLAGFGVPRVAEDDALRAVRAAVEMQQAFRALAREQAGLAGDIGLRVAVYTGEVVAGDNRTHVMGDPVNVAARLQQEARDGDVLLGESTRRLVAEKVTLAPFGSFSLKGRAEPVAAYRVVSLERPAGAPAIAFVGREDELRRIRAVYDTAVAGRAARLAVLLGSPGLGKSRLIDEFTRRLGDGATVLLAHCDAAGGATFAPLAEALRGALRVGVGVSGDDLRAAILSGLPEGAPERARIAEGVAALLAGTPASPEEIFFVVRRALGALAAVRPVVLAIDDIQWAEPLLLDLIEHLVQWGNDVPMLVLAAARPELRDARSSLATSGGYVSDVVTLTGLDAGAATRLAANVIGAEALPAAIAGRVLATSEGNPLFVGELVRMLVHDGALKREGERWTAGVALEGLEMPPTIHALLAARIERLRPEDRTVLERAAVVGRHFSRTALAQLLPREIGDLGARLESLRRSELVEPDAGWFLGEPALRFHHVLIRDAAYRRLLKNTRAELHARFADWLEARAAGAAQHDEVLGWHLEQAHQHLRELGPIDAQGRALGERAARHLAAAGRRALARDDLTPAASLVERALGLLDPLDPARADLALDWCEAALSAGDVATAVRAIAELGRFLGDSDRLRAWYTCFNGQLAVLTDPKALRASADAVEAAAATLTSAGDAAGEAKAHSVHALVLAQLGKVGACETALDKALAAARRARDRRRANAVLAGAPVAALWGPSPITRASGRCLDVVRVLRITQGAPAVEAVALRCQAVLETLRGRAEAARRMIASSRRMVEELGITQRVLEADLFTGLIELLEGDAAGAECSLRVAYDGLRAQGLGIDAAQAAALLGRALLAQGRIAEAEAVSDQSESLAGDSFKAAIAWRGVRAEALAARGEHAAAIGFAGAAVEIAAATDDLLDHADARQALAAALRAAGRSAEADAEEKRAVELWEAKGATLLTERARRGGARSIDSPRLAEPLAAPAQAVPRSVGPNAATATVARMAAVTAARDADALMVESPAACLANAASRSLHRFERCWRERDWDGMAATLAPAHRLDDRRRLVGLRMSTEESWASLRFVFAVPQSRMQGELLATRGERLALFRIRITGQPPGSGPMSEEHLQILELDAGGRQEAIVLLDLDDLAGAYAELDARYHAGEAAPYARVSAGMQEFKRAFQTRDWEALAARCASDLVVHDHRLLGWHSLHGPAAYLEALRTLVDLAPDTRLRIDHTTIVENGYLVVTVWEGTREGGAYEAPSLMIAELDGQGRIRRFDQYDLEKLDQAQARFADLREGPLRIPPNAATLTIDRWVERQSARNWEGLAELLATGFVFEDRRRLTRHTGNRDMMMASIRMVGSSGFHPSHVTLATAGDRLALSQVRFRSFDGTALVAEVEVLQISEVGADGRMISTITFDPDDRRAASLELTERYFRGEEMRESPRASSELVRALNAHDLVRLRSALPDDFYLHDHRRTGLGRLEGADAYVDSVRALLEQTRDLATDILYHVAGDERGSLSVGRMFGTLPDGGAFENVLVRLAVFRGDRVAGLEVFEPEDLGAARARFEQLRP